MIRPSVFIVAALGIGCMAMSDQTSKIKTVPELVQQMDTPLTDKELMSEEKAFLGVGLRVIDVDKISDGTIKKGYKVTIVLPNSAAHRAGMLRDDIILKYDDKVLDDVAEKKQSSALREYLFEFKKVGAKITLDVVRLSRFLVDEAGQKQPFIESEITEKFEHKGVDEQVKITLEKQKKRQKIVATLGLKVQGKVTDLPKPEQLMPQDKTLKAKYGEQALTLIHATGLTDEWNDLRYRYAKDELWQGQADGLCRKDAFQYMRLKPHKSLAANHYLADQLLQSQDAFPLMDRWMLDSASPQTLITWQAENLSELMDQLIEHINRIGKLRDQAFAALDKDQQHQLADLSKKVADRFSQSFYINLGKGDELALHRQNQNFFELIQQVDLSKMLTAGKMIKQLNDKKLMALIEALIEKERPDPPLFYETVMMKDSSYGKVIIGGKGDNTYRERVALLIDVGGNDWYFGVNHADPQNKVSVVIDQAGDDKYYATSDFAQGGALMAVSGLFDWAGNDIYLSKNFAQGMAWIGVGLLQDDAGDDRYNVHQYGQGSAFFGLAQLVDDAGDDRYSGSLYVQGVGGTCGMGLILDGSGDDEYISGTHKPSSYGTQGIFQGASQAVGIGFRGYARGGIGVLLDQAGHDQYQTGNFSLGTGYFFGLGLLYEGSGDDIYLASRYGVGASAHSAIGAFIEMQGNDQYYANNVAIVAAAWDISLSLFADYAGNDRYFRSHHNFNGGIASHNGFALMVDDQGDDIYTLSTPSVSNDYHGGWSFAFRFDQAGQDEYQLMGQNNDLSSKSYFGFTLDWEATAQDFHQQLHHKFSDDLKRSIEALEATEDTP